MIFDVIDQALYYIQSQQQSSGNFIDNNATPAVFYTGLIATTLACSNDPISTAIQEQALSFLLQQKSDKWSWNYWRKNTITLYPDDMDDTFVALQGLSTYDKTVIDETVWSSIIKNLIVNETAPGGPYYTWILDNTERTSAWQNIDIVVNSNISTFLDLYDITLPALELFFDNSVANNNLFSEYYHEEYIVIYFLSKAYKGLYKNVLKEKILSKRNNHGYWNSSLENAMAISSLLRLGEKPEVIEKAVQHLIDTHNNGRWKSDPLFIDRKYKDSIAYSSCSAYVSACCIEALTLYNESISSHQEKDQDIFIKEVVRSCKNQFLHLSQMVQQQIVTLIDELIAKDSKKEIILLPYLFASRLSFSIDKKMVFSLAVANVLGWIGYSIKDAIQDGEPKQHFLSSATLCIRKSTKLLYSCATNYFSEKDIDTILNNIEESLIWEHAYCYIGVKTLSTPEYNDYKVLAEKSFGHAIGPLLLSSLSEDREQIEHIKIFFEHYLIARQMNDDAHDWPEDLKNGYVNSVSSLFLTEENYRKSLSALNELFWKQHIDNVCAVIQDHIDQARVTIQNITILSNSDVLENLLIPLEKACLKAIIERNKTRKLLEIMQLQ